MGFTLVKVLAINMGNLEKKEEVECLVDTGALHSVIPKELLGQLQILPTRKREFTLANGQVIERWVGDALFRLDNQEGASPVIFGEEGDRTLLGVVTLEALGLEVDPTTKKLKPIPHWLL